MADAVIKRGPGRPRKEDRATAERTERRRKAGSVVVDGRKLTVQESELDRANYEYRFVADRGGRVQSLYDQDWDVVEGKETPHGGVEENNSPYKMVLMRKRKDWYEADRKEKLEPADQIDEQLKRNNAGALAAQTDADLAQHAYTPGANKPGGGNSIEVSQGYKP